MSDSIEARIKSKARELGFALVGIARASQADNFERYREWLDRGYAGEMHYLHKHFEHRRDPSAVLQDVRSVVMMALTYGGETQATGARIAKYAQAPDYHRFIWDKLNILSNWLGAQVPGSRSHGVADSAPLLERDFARRAGLGWFGKNTMLLNKELGSFFLLCGLLTTLDLQPDPPHENSHCGRCTACLDACPTQAFVESGWLDARKCVSYLTIELKGAMPEELRAGVGEWLFGCDVCQDVCPWNHPLESPVGLPLREDLMAIDPVELLMLSPNELRRKFEGTSLRRANWRGLLRNAAIVLGNQRKHDALPALRDALKWEDEVVREACEWAIRQMEVNPA